MDQEKIITLSEKGLCLQTLSESTKVLDCCFYIHKNGTICVASNSELTFYDVETENAIKSHTISDVKNTDLCNCGSTAAAHEFSKTLHVFTKEKLDRTIPLVDTFSLSCNLLGYVLNNILQVVEFGKDDPVASFENVMEFFVFKSLLFYTTRKNASNLKQKLVYVNFNEKTHKKVEFLFDMIRNIEITPNKHEDTFMVCVTTDYAINSYFGNQKLYIFNTTETKLKDVKHVDPILDYKFIDNGYAICHGPQPSSVTVFNDKHLEVKSFPKGIRNKIYFNPHYNLVCFAGFGNLSGDIEVYSNKLLSKFKVLGASSIEWSPCGRYFIVAVTNELKVDNRIEVFDYFGRKIDVREYLKLLKCSWLGVKKTFSALKEPEKYNIEEVKGYVPPNLRKENKELYKYQNQAKKENYKSNSEIKKNHKVTKEDEKVKVQNKNIHSKDKKSSKNTLHQNHVNTTSNEKFNKKDKESLELLKKNLSEIQDLKNKISAGEILGIEDLNKVLKEDEITQKLKNYK